ncbi:MAG: relaxase domain-containing protein, partial [Rhodospirillaceae bacterium]|nr:relaxase domain-containing protein [Rhodospirillaceae bacterium]
MLSGPRQLASAEQTFGYFLHEYLARNDGSHRSANRWHGEGAAALGLGQRVGKRKFISILSGHVPDTDIKLGRIIDGERQHRPGWDMTFSAPKSVSLEALYHGRRAVMHAHDEAVRATLDWIEREHLQTRGYDPATGRRPREAADGLVAATFRHMASRNNDPQLHTHAVVANMTRNMDGEWRSVEPTLLKRNRRVFGAWYRNDLARRLRDLGYELVPTTVGGLPSFEIAGWSREWLEAFSTRRQDILKHMESEGLEYTTANAQAATLATRGKKVEPVKGELVKLWRHRAEALGLVEARRDRKARPDRVPERPRLSSLEAVWQATAHLEERQCVFRRTDLLAAALGRDPGRHSHGELEAAIDRLREDRNLVDTKSGDLTTRQTLEAERDVIAAMREVRGRAAPLADERDVSARLEATSLTDGQRDAVRTILLSEDRIVGVQGFAGTGKTRMLKEVVRLAGDRPVIGLAPSSAAARVLALEAGIGTTTLQWMLARYGDLGDADGPELREARERFRGAVIVVDEASMIGTVQMRSLQNVAERLGASRLALVGDRLQLRSVEAGQPFRLLQEAGMETARMDDILRQRSVDLKAAVTHMVAGDADLALHSLGADVKELPPDRLPETAANLWLALPPEARRRTVILAPTHAQREETTAVLRKGLAEEGVLGGRTLETERFVDRRLTRVLAADPQSYRPGDVVVANRDVYGLGKGEAWRVTSSGEDGIALERRGAVGGFRPSGKAAHNVSVFETRPISLRAGDE